MTLAKNALLAAILLTAGVLGGVVLSLLADACGLR
jgi:hypothetical protein